MTVIIIRVLIINNKKLDKKAAIIQRLITLWSSKAESRIMWAVEWFFFCSNYCTFGSLWVIMICRCTDYNLRKQISWSVDNWSRTGININEKKFTTSYSVGNCSSGKTTLIKQLKNVIGKDFQKTSERNTSMWYITTYSWLSKFCYLHHSFMHKILWIAEVATVAMHILKM